LRACIAPVLRARRGGGIVGIVVFAGDGGQSHRFLSYLFEAEANESGCSAKSSASSRSRTCLSARPSRDHRVIEWLDEKKIRRQLPTLLESDFVRRGAAK
jgi:hypothetical protein